VSNPAQAASQLRFARPTDQLPAIESFYGDGVGLEEIGRFSDHAGYDGVIFGLPDRRLHLEFTQEAGAGPCYAPSRDNLLVFYVPDEGARQEVSERLRRLGHQPVAAENPYWETIGALTFEDPDGWRVVLSPTPGI
jgi:YycE-like N-terminal domain/YycE-like C-terminal domain